MKDCKIRGRVADDGLKIDVIGKIDSTNAADAGAAMRRERELHPEGRVEFDFSRVQYISSAGLRELLKFQKAEKDKIRIVELEPDVYDVFEVTGFSQIFDVRKTVDEFSVEGLEEIGRGANGRVFRVDEETILKVANPEYSLDYVEHERRMSQVALVAGLPTAIPFQTVKVGDSYGALYELVDTSTLAATAEANSDLMPELGERLGRLLRDLSMTRVDDDELPDLRLLHIDRARKLSTWLSAEETATVIAAYEALPQCDTYVHGDLNLNNIMVQDGELIMIDMGALGFGHPLLDLAAMCMVLEIAYQSGPEAGYQTTGVPQEVASAVWRTAKDTYFGLGEPPSPVGETMDKLILGYGLCQMGLVPTYRSYLPDDLVEAIMGALRQAMPLVSALPQMVGAFVMPSQP